MSDFNRKSRIPSRDWGGRSPVGRRARAINFRRVAGAYERGRPGYPVDAIRWLLGRAPLEIIDLGAGTGKLTRQLVAEGHHVVAAVEPVPELREVLERSAPGVSACAGRAEDIPLPDRCTDAVAVGQAYHWFEPGEAIPEIARVLRPSGTLALLWNRSDKSLAWLQAVGRLALQRRSRSALRRRVRILSRARGRRAPPRSGGTGRESLHTAWRAPLEDTPLFDGIEGRTFSHEQRIGLDRLIDLVSSKSYVASRKRSERRELLSQVERLWREHPDLAGREEVTLRYYTDAYRCRRSRSPLPMR